MEEAIVKEGLSESQESSFKDEIVIEVVDTIDSTGGAQDEVQSKPIVTETNSKKEKKEVLSAPPEYSISPLFYDSRLDISDRKTQATISQLQNLFEQNPGMKLEIQCHSSNEGILEFKLFSSVKLAEKLEKALIALVRRNNTHGVSASQYNSRIEFKFYDFDQKHSNIKRINPEIPDHSISNKYDLYQALSDNTINYKIQIAIVGQMYRGLALDLFNDAAVEEDEVTGLYLYTIGLYDTYSEALKTRRDIERLGITDAKVLPYYDGRILSDDRLAYYVNDYPDLKNFMNYGN